MKLTSRVSVLLKTCTVFLLFLTACGENTPLTPLEAARINEYFPLRQGYQKKYDFHYGYYFEGGGPPYIPTTKEENGQCVLSVSGVLEKSKVNFVSLDMAFSFSDDSTRSSVTNNYYLIQSADSLWYVNGVSDLSDLDKGQRSLMMHHPNLHDNFLNLALLGEPFHIVISFSQVDNNLILVHDDNRRSLDSEIKGDTLIYRYSFGGSYEFATGELKCVKNSGIVELNYRYEKGTNYPEIINLNFKESGSL